jgi:glucose-1-phosphate thymidylyltransferase
VREIGDRAAATKFGTVVLHPGSRRMALYEEKPKEPKSSLVSTTCAVFPPSVFPLILNYSLTHPDNNGGVWEQFLLNGVPCEAFPFTEAWFDIGSYEAYLAATVALVGENVEKDPTATLADSVTKGSVVLGANSVVKRSELTDTVLFEDCVVEDCVLDRCILDRGCVLKGVDLSGKMLRAGTTLTR